MVYDWEAHKDVIVRLYTEEGLEVDDIIEHMHKHYDFSPRYVNICCYLGSCLFTLRFSSAARRAPCTRRPPGRAAPACRPPLP